jgi:hypothetical protein
MYAVLDIFFLVFHASLIAFILTGWIWKRTRRLHLLVMVLTSLSWFVLGLFYGIGYCASTDWHWQVKRARGETGLPNSYVKYYIDRLTGLNWDPRLVDVTLGLIGLAALGLSIGLNWRDWRRPVSKARSASGITQSSKEGNFIE